MTDSKNIMLISPNKVKGYGVVNINVTDAEIGNAIRISQNVYLKDIIGKDLIEHIQQLINNKLISSGSSIDDEENIAYKTLLEEYITPVLV